MPRRTYKAASRESVEDILRSAAEAEGLAAIEEEEQSESMCEFPITQVATEVVNGSCNVKDAGLITVHRATESLDSNSKDSTSGDVEAISTIDEVENSHAVGESDKLQVDEDDADGIVNYEDSLLVLAPNVTEPHGS